MKLDTKNEPHRKWDLIEFQHWSEILFVNMDFFHTFLNCPLFVIPVLNVVFLLNFNEISFQEKVFIKFYGQEIISSIETSFFISSFFSNRFWILHILLSPLIKLCAFENFYEVLLVPGLEQIYQESGDPNKAFKGPIKKNPPCQSESEEKTVPWHSHYWKQVLMSKKANFMS